MKESDKKEKPKKENLDSKSQNKDKTSSGEEMKMDSASAFSSETEKLFQEKISNKGKLLTLHNAFNKSLNPPSTPDNGKKTKWADLRVRTIWSIIMISGYYVLLCLGHFYTALLVCLLTISVNFELTELPRYRERNNAIDFYYFNQWYLFSIGMYFLFGRVMKEQILNTTQNSIVIFLLRYHGFICFLLYVTYFLMFLFSLKGGFMRYQFRNFAFGHIIILILCVPTSLIASNIFSGLFWFALPCNCVCISDVGGYIFGKAFGKHQLSKLSPKKTWEGYIGGVILTIIWTYIHTEIFIKFPYLLCPMDHVELIPFHNLNLNCNTNELLKIINVKFSLFNIPFSFSVRNIQFHAFIIGLFASAIGPMGGLFASAFKRSIKIKDFADTIPGHGGVTDRIDCEFLMGMFTFVYINNFVFIDEKANLLKLVNKISKLDRDSLLFIYGAVEGMLGVTPKDSPLIK